VSVDVMMGEWSEDRLFTTTSNGQMRRGVEPERTRTRVIEWLALSPSLTHAHTHTHGSLSHTHISPRLSLVALADPTTMKV